MTLRDTYVLVFDGGSRGNPGPGYGSFRWRHGGEPWSEPARVGFGDWVTNNEAEYLSLIAGLRALAAECGTPCGSAVEVRSDSRLVVEHLRGRWKVRARNLKPLYAEARMLLAGFASVRLVWHPREKSVGLLGH